MGGFLDYNYIVNEKNGEKFCCTDFYVYPLTADDYADVYRNYSIDKYPAMAFMYITNKCTDNCIGCFAKAIEDGNACLEKDVILRTIKDLAEHGTKALKLAGREPTASPYLSDCLNYCKELGLKTLVISSGANIDKHIDALSESCTLLRLSLNTVSQELHEKIHRPTSEALCFNDRIKYAQEIIDRRRKNNLVTGATYLVRTSDDKIGYRYAKMCREMGFDFVRFTVLDENKGNWSEEWVQMFNTILTLQTKDFKIIVHNPIPKCEVTVSEPLLFDPALASRVVIHANGKVSACQEGWRGKWCQKEMAIYGNINEADFNSIWTGEKRKDFLKHIQDTHTAGMENHGCYASGNAVCSHNCKYNSFNIIQRWIINQLEKEPNSTFKPICKLENW